MKSSHSTIYVLLFLAAQCLFNQSPLLGLETDTTASKPLYSCTVEGCRNNYGKGSASSQLKENHLLNQHTKCPLCPSLTFSSKKDLHEHMIKDHPKKKIYYCETCNNFITNISTYYKSHQTRCNKPSQTSEIDLVNNPYTTTLDESLLDTIQTNPDFQETLDRTHQTQITLNAPNNGLSFVSSCSRFRVNQNTVHKHDQQAGNLKALQCPIEDCDNNKGKGFSRNEKLVNHLHNQHIKCQLCISSKFRTKKDLHEHMTNIHSRKTYYCETCNDFITNIKNHHKSHKQKCNPELKQTLPCPIEDCDNKNGKKFAYQRHLENHLLNQHIKCRSCISLTFRSKKDLHEHMTNTHSKKTYYCSTCNDFITNHNNNYKEHNTTCNKRSLTPSKRKNPPDDSINNIQSTRTHLEDNLNFSEIDFLNSPCSTALDQAFLDAIQIHPDLYEIFNHTDQTQITLNDNNIFSDNILDILSLDLLEQSMVIKSGPNPGIINENGTDCFMSTTLQVLSNIPALEKFFMENAFNKNSYTASLINFFNKLRTEQSAIRDVAGLRQYLTTHPELSSMAFGQHDAQEFLIKLLSLLDGDINHTVGCVHELKNIFGINLTQHFMCNTCHQSMHNTQVETSFAFPLPDEWSTITPQALLNNLLCQSEFVSDYRCEACQTSGITRKTALKKLPEILILSVNRFGYENDQAYRINTPVFSEKKLTLCDEHGISFYKIMGIIAQEGTLQHGHYTAYVQDSFDGKWYLYDDDQRIDVLRDYDDKEDITPVVNRSTPYIFFYKRVNLINIHV